MIGSSCDMLNGTQTGTCNNAGEIVSDSAFLDVALSLSIKTILVILFHFSILRISWINHPIFRDSRSPKMVPYAIPFFGSAAAFWGDITGFISMYTKKYKSDIFAAYVGGRPIVFVTDPFAAANLISGRIPQLSWSDTKFRLLNHAMQTSEDGANVWAQMDTRIGHSLLEKHLMKNDNLHDNLMKYQHHLKHSILPALACDANEKKNSNEFRSVGIMDLVGGAIYRSTAESLYGYKTFSTHEDFQQSILFDKKLALFTGIKSGWIQKKLSPLSFEAREDMVEKMRQVYRSLEEQSKNNESNIDTSTQSKLSKMAVEVDNLYNDKMNHEDLTRYRYLYFAAAFMNTVPAAFWSFYEMMANEEAFNAVRKEILDLYAMKSEPGYKPIEKKGNETKEENAIDEDDGENKYSAKEYFTLAELDQMECLDSIITETLRLRSTNKMLRVRYAIDDFEIKLNLPITQKVHQFHVKKGTYFVSLPTVMHRDPEIFKDPLVFQWDRFRKDPQTGKLPVFSKNGKKIIRPVDAFGGGPTMCPGRRFARTEIKAVISSLIVHYDFRFPKNESGAFEVPAPPIDHVTFVNSGMPLHDVQIEIKDKVP